MKNLLLLAVLVPAMAWAQDSQTNCYTYGEGSTQCRTTERRVPQVTAPDIAGAFLSGANAARQEQALRQQADLAAAERRNLELQNEALQRQFAQGMKAPTTPDPVVISFEASVFQSAFVAILQQQWELPEEKRISGDTVALQANANAEKLIGHALHVESIALATKRLEEAFARAAQSPKP